jgi:5,10-methenyltetrahydrofolate synthetase
MTAAEARGASCALPIVVEKGSPLAFRTWKVGEPLSRGVWNIPFPRRGREVLPDLVIAPLVGFDTSCFRLGYGGGYFDRTLALLNKATLVGVGFESQKLNTIHPMKHDIPMDIIVTDVGVRVR